MNCKICGKQTGPAFGMCSDCIKTEDTVKLLHDIYSVNANHKYFVCGRNPDGKGGGAIASFNSYKDAYTVSLQAINQGYTRVRVMTYEEIVDCG